MAELLAKTALLDGGRGLRRRARRTAAARGARSPRAGSPARGGFTLLEVMIALAILAVSLVAISGINSGALNMHIYSKRLTIATLLARSKMADLEQKLQSDGLPSDDAEEDGSFDEEGFPEYRWQAQIIRPKTEKVNTLNLLALTGMGLGPDSKSGAQGGLLSNLPPDIASKIPGGPSALTGAAGQGGPVGGGMGGLLGGMMQSQMQIMLDSLGKMMREVRLTVFWKNGKIIDQFTIVTHVVSLGLGTDQANSAAPTTTGQTPSMTNSPPGTFSPANNNLMRFITGGK